MLDFDWQTTKSFWDKICSQSESTEGKSQSALASVAVGTADTEGSSVVLILGWQMEGQANHTGMKYIQNQPK